MAGIGATVALIKALAPKADPDVIQQAVEDYLEAHPEISVADGSITEEKLAEDVAGILDDLQDDVSDVKTAIHGMNTATASDVGKALSPKTVVNGKVTEWKYVESGSVDPSAIADKVDDWCDENITNPSNPPLDRSLLLENAAAPADLVGDLKSDVSFYTGNKKFEYTKDKYIKYQSPQTKTNESSWECVLVQCSPGDVFSVKGFGGSSPRLWIFSDSQGNALTYALAGTVTNDFVKIIAPANAAYLACNSKYSEFHGVLIEGEILKEQVDSVELAHKMDTFNQIVPDGNFETASGWQANGSPSWPVSASDNILTATVASSEMKLQRTNDYPAIIVGHKYFATVEYNGSDLNRVAVKVGVHTQIGDVTSNTWNKIATIITVSSISGDKTDCQVEVTLNQGYSAQTIQIRNYWVVDITAMYGAGNEPTVQQFLTMYSNAYYPHQSITKDTKVMEYLINKKIAELGTASQKDYTNSVSEGGNNLPTAIAVYTAIQEAQGQSSDSMVSRDAYLIKEEIPSQYTEHNASPVSFDDDEYLEKKLATVPTGKKLLYFTDVHWPSNEKKTIPLVNYVRKRLGIPKVLFGGDVLNRSDTGYIAKSVYTSFMYQAKSAFWCDFIPAIGNHETNESNMQGSSHTDVEREAKLLPFSQIQPIQGSDLLDYVHTEYDMVKDDLSDYATGDNLDELKAYFKTIFYFDDSANKTRYIVLNTGNPGSLNDAGGLGVISDVFHFGWTGELRLQFDWFASVLSTTPNGYDVVVLGHQFANENADLDMPKYPQIIMQMCRGAIQKQSITVTPPQLSNTYSNMIAWYSNSNHVYDFTEIQQIRSIIMVCGHAHYDGISINGYNGNNEYVSTVYNGETLDQIEDGVIPLIVTTTDAYQSWDVSVSGATKVPMEYGTTTDHAFDVMTYVDDGIDIKRFGAGNNRKIYINYPSES